MDHNTCPICYNSMDDCVCPIQEYIIEEPKPNPEDDDEYYETLYDGNGNSVRRLKMQSKVISKPGEFTIHDSSKGHCGLCGRLGCHGGCFK